jgi:predicted  nucleic acid-binding Zn-ribbon protein
MPHQCTACGHVFEDGSKEMLSGCPDCGGNKFQFRPAGESANESNEVQAPDSTSDTPDEPEPRIEDSSSVAETVGRATTRVRDFVSSAPAPPDEPNRDAEWPGEWEGTPKASGGDADSASDGEDKPPGGDGDIIDADARRKARSTPGEDTAQANARSDVVSPSELDIADRSPSDPDADTVEDRADTNDGTGTDADKTSTGPTTADADENIEQPTPTRDAPANGEIVGEPTGEEPDLTELREQLNDQFESIKILEPGQYELNLMELYDREEYIIALQENGRYVIQVPEQWIGDDPDDR